MDKGTWGWSRVGAWVLLVLAGTTLACGGGGGGGGDGAGDPAVTGFAPSTIPAEEATGFTVTGRGFGPVGQNANIRVTAMSGAPFMGGGTSTIFFTVNIASETQLTGTSEPCGVLDAADARITVMLPDGREIDSSGAVVTFEPPRPTLLDPSVLRSCMPVYFDVEGAGLGRLGTTVTIRFTAPSGTPFLGGTSDHLDVESLLTSPTSIVAALPWDAARSDFVADTTLLWPSGGQAHLPNSAWFRPEVELVDGTGYAGDAAGHAVAIEGDHAVVGRPYDGTAGSADVYLRTGETWAYQATLRPSDAPAGRDFGTSVAISGDTILVGGPGVQGGAAYAFVRSGVVWREEQIITPPGAAVWDRFGSSVAVRGDFALVGAPQGGLSAGLGYAAAFTRSATTWSLERTWSSPTGDAWSFGASVALSSHGTPPTVLVGIPGGTDPYGSDPVTRWDTGSVAVYAKEGGSWTRRAWFHPELARNGDRFGSSLSTDQRLLAVGAPGDDILSVPDAGRAYVYERQDDDSTVWDEVAARSSPQMAVDGSFGASVAVQGDILVVGAPEETGNAAGSGAVHVYDRLTGTFQHELTLGARFGAGGDRYGQAVALDDMRVLAGAPGQDLVAPDGGQAYIH